MDVRVVPGSEPFFDGETDVAYTDGSAITLMIRSSIDADDITLEFRPEGLSSLGTVVGILVQQYCLTRRSCGALGRTGAYQHESPSGRMWTHQM